MSVWLFLLLLLLLLLAGTPSGVRAQTLQPELIRDGGRLVVGARLGDVRFDQILSSVRDGLETRVSFQFRLFGPTRGVRSLFGNRLLDEVEVVHGGSMDFFDGRYILDSDHPEQTTRSYESPEEFIQALLWVHGILLDAHSQTTPDGAYVMARARLDYVKLDPPLSIISLFRRTGVLSEWYRMDLTED